MPAPTCVAETEVTRDFARTAAKGVKVVEKCKPIRETHSELHVNLQSQHEGPQPPSLGFRVQGLGFRI